MNSTEKIAHGRAAQGRAQWLALEPHPVLAILYPAQDGAEAVATGTAVLFCPAFGWEEMCSYRGRRAWARALAQAGFPAATLSLPGSGDSGGSPRDTRLLEAWTASVSGAAQWLTGATGDTRVTAVGIGLGGMLACHALAAGAPIDDLILWGVPADGRAWLRELRASARIIGSRHPEDHRPEVDPEGEHEYTGFHLSAETAHGLQALRLTDLDLPRSSDRRVLLLGRDGRAPDPALHALSIERMRELASSLHPAQVRAGAGRPTERAQSAEIELALDRLRDRGTETLLLFSQGEALHDQLRRQGVLDRLERWPNLTVETIPSRNHMFRALWLQRHVHESLDRALERVLAAKAPTLQLTRTASLP